MTFGHPLSSERGGEIQVAKNIAQRMQRRAEFADLWGELFWFGNISMTHVKLWGVCGQNVLVWQCGRRCGGGRSGAGDTQAIHHHGHFTDSGQQKHREHVANLLLLEVI